MKGPELPDPVLLVRCGRDASGNLYGDASPRIGSCKKVAVNKLRDQPIPGSAN